MKILVQLRFWISKNSRNPITNSISVSSQTQTNQLCILKTHVYASDPQSIRRTHNCTIKDEHTTITHPGVTFRAFGGYRTQKETQDHDRFLFFYVPSWSPAFRSGEFTFAFGGNGWRSAAVTVPLHSTPPDDVVFRPWPVEVEEARDHCSSGIWCAIPPPSHFPARFRLSTVAHSRT